MSKIQKKDQLISTMIEHPTCKSCSSPYRPEIDRKLLDGDTYTSISKWLDEEHDVSISVDSISRHHKNHVQKLITKEALTRYEKEVQATVSELEFLDFLRQACYDSIVEGRTEVSAYEATKATKLKLEYTEERPGLQKLIDALSNIAASPDERLAQRESP